MVENSIGRVVTQQLSFNQRGNDYYEYFDGRVRTCRRCGFEYNDHRKDAYLAKTKKGWYCKGCRDIDEER